MKIEKFDNRRLKMDVRSMKGKKKNILGFTLIELLVVISIIGILATFSIANFSAAQAKARDAQRKNDLSQIGKALELWRNDTAGGAYYPGNLDQYDGSDPNDGLVNKGYLKSLPKDPSRNTDYCYIPMGTINSSGATEYGLMALVDNQNDPDATDTALTGICLKENIECLLDAKCFTRTNP